MEGTAPRIARDPPLFAAREEDVVQPLPGRLQQLARHGPRQRRQPGKMMEPPTGTVPVVSVDAAKLSSISVTLNV